jgi:hypothetical protein
MRIRALALAPLIAAADIMISAVTFECSRLAERGRLSTILSYLRDVREGGLMFYGARPAWIWQCAARLVDKIQGF